MCAAEGGFVVPEARPPAESSARARALSSQPPLAPALPNCPRPPCEIACAPWQDLTRPGVWATAGELARIFAGWADGVARKKSPASIELAFRRDSPVWRLPQAAGRRACLISGSPPAASPVAQ